jgi:transcriptional regulator with XRE-family HTH domain
MPKATGGRSRVGPRDIAKQELARRLQVAMDAKGWNQSDLAREAAKHTRDKQFHRGNVSVYMNGTSMPRREHLLAMAKALGKTPEDLLPPYLMQGEESGPSTVQMLDLGNGRCTLIVQKEVSASVALKVWTILQEADNGSH